MKNWESFCEQFLAIRGSRNYSREIKSLMKTMNRDKTGLKPDDYQWFLDALLDEKRKWFVVFFLVFFLSEIIRRNAEKLYQPLIGAAILEESSSQNRKFIELCLKTYGHREVYDTLLQYVKNGSNEEKKGAVRALYWAKPKLVFAKDAKDHSFKNATPESKKLYNSVRGLEIRKNNILLRAFIENEDSDVRRALIPALKLRTEHAPEEAKPLIEQAIEIARASDDEFLSERVEIQTGGEKTPKPLATTAKE